jgi:hypothetical protein
MEYENGYISYLSDANGINNRYIASFDSVINYIDTATHYRYITKSFPITDYKQSIIEQDISPRAGKTAEIIFTDGVYKMYVEDRLTVSNLTAKKLDNTEFIKRLLYEKETLKKDTLNKEIDKPEPVRKKLRNVYYSDVPKDDEQSDEVSIQNNKQAFSQNQSKRQLSNNE